METQNIKSTLQHARDYVKKGFSVIPLKPRGKEPIISSWKEYQERYPTDEELVKWFNGSQNNIGVVTGRISGIVVVDLDSEAAIRFSKENDFGITPAVKTGKGYHLYFSYPPDREVRNFQARDDLPDIDLRGDGGYVVGPPSIHSGGKVYQWLPGAGLGLSFAPLPTILLINDATEKAPLKELYQGVSEGERNISLARLVGSWANDFLTLEECLENALLWNDKNESPLPEREIERTVQSIFEMNRKTNPQKDVQPKDKKMTSIADLPFISASDLRNDDSTEYRQEKIEGMIPEGTLLFLSGIPGHMKTFLAMDLCLAITTQRPFVSRQTKQGTAFYFDKENHKKTWNDRMNLLCKTTIPETFQVWPFWVEPEPPAFPKGEDSIYADIAKQNAGALFIFDSFIRFLPKGVDENSSSEVAPVMGFLRGLTKHGVTVVILHHKGKNDSLDYRGSSEILASVDIAYSITKDGNRLNLKCLKNRFKQEENINIEVREDVDGYLFFEDVTALDREKKKREQEDLLIKIRDYIIEMKIAGKETTQTQVIELIKNKLEIGKNKIRDALQEGIGKYWNITDAPGHKKLYGALSYPVKNSPLHGNTQTIDNIESKGCPSYPTTIYIEDNGKTLGALSHDICENPTGNDNVTACNDKEKALSYPVKNTIEDNGKTLNDDFIPEDDIPEVEGERWNF